MSTETGGETAEELAGRIVGALHDRTCDHADRDCGETAADYAVVLAELNRLVASPEPYEPPPGVYRGEHERFKAWAYVEEFRGIEPGSPNRWVPVGDRVAYTFEGALEAGMRPDQPLSSVDELIPDPDDPDALLGLHAELERDGQDRDRYAPPMEFSQAVCRVLRERAEARQTEGCSDR